MCLVSRSRKFELTQRREIRDELFREMCERDGIPVPIQVHLPEPFDRTMFENSAN